jgi:hypothetical protein
MPPAGKCFPHAPRARSGGRSGHRRALGRGGPRPTLSRRLLVRLDRDGERWRVSVRARGLAPESAAIGGREALSLDCADRLSRERCVEAVVKICDETLQIVVE